MGCIEGTGPDLPLVRGVDALLPHHLPGTRARSQGRADVAVWCMLSGSAAGGGMGRGVGQAEERLCAEEEAAQQGGA